MEQKGFTDFGYNDLKRKERIESFIQSGAKYLIVNDTSIIKKEHLQDFTYKKIGEYKNVAIFKL